MALVVNSAVDLFRDLGISSAVIQKKGLADTCLSSIFWLNTSLGIGLTGLVWLFSPLVSQFYREPRLGSVLTAIAPVSFVAGLGLVHRSLLERDLRFQALAKAEMVATLAASIISVWVASVGFGVWSLVLQSLTNVTFSVAIAWLTTGWLPSKHFRWSDIRPLAKFSMGLVGFNLCNFCSRNADYLLIGRFLGTRELGLYTIAYRLMLYPLHNISAVMGRIMFPVLAQINEDLPRFRRGYLTAISSIALASFPMMTGLMVTADLLVPVVLGSQWKPVVPLIQILASIGLIQSIGTTVGSIYQAKARTDLLLEWGLLSSSLTVLSFAIGLNWGTVGVASAYALVSVALAVPSIVIPFRLIGLELSEFASRLWRPAVCSLVMGGVVLSLRPIIDAVYAPRESLIFSVVGGLLAYCVLSWGINRASVQQSFEAAGVSLLPKTRGAKL